MEYQVVYYGTTIKVIYAIHMPKNRWGIDIESFYKMNLIE